MRRTDGCHSRLPVAVFRTTEYMDEGGNRMRAPVHVVRDYLGACEALSAQYPVANLNIHTLRLDTKYAVPIVNRHRGIGKKNRMASDPGQVFQKSTSLYWKLLITDFIRR